jgi:uncharacterized membrane protein
VSAPARRSTIAIVALGLVAALVIVFTFDPAHAGFFPACPWRLLTGFLCPGCGVLRGTHALLHGDVAAAWALNPLWVIVAPLLAVSFAWSGLRAWGVPLPAVKVPAAAMWGMLLVVVAFGVLRNL